MCEAVRGAVIRIVAYKFYAVQANDSDANDSAHSKSHAERKALPAGLFVSGSNNESASKRNSSDHGHHFFASEISVE